MTTSDLVRAEHRSRLVDDMPSEAELQAREERVRANAEVERWVDVLDDVPPDQDPYPSGIYLDEQVATP